MYGVAKVHKPDIPLRPILAKIGSPQHFTATLLPKILAPVSEKHSTYVVKDSFRVSEEIRQCSVPSSTCMYLYIKSVY